MFGHFDLMDVVSDFPPNLIITIYYNLCKFTVASFFKSKYVNLFFDFDLCNFDFDLCNFDFDLCNFDFDLYEFDIDLYKLGFELYEFDFDSALVR